MTRHTLSLFFITALLAGAASASAPPAESFFKSAENSIVTLSPKGAYVAIVTTLPGDGQALLIRDTADPTKARGIARAGELERITAVHWINENRLGYTVKNRRIEFEGNLDEFAVDRDGGNSTHLISGNWNHQQQNTGTSLKTRTLTAEYAFFDVPHDGSDDILVEKYTWNNIDRAPDHSRLYRLNTRTRELANAFEGGQPAAVKEWLTDDRGEPRVAMSQVKGRCIGSYRKPGGEWVELENSPCYENTQFSPLFFGGADTLYVAANYQGYGSLYRYDLKTMKLAATPLLTMPGFDFNGAPVKDWTTGQLLGIHLQSDAGTTAWLNPAMKAEQAKIDALLPGTTNTIHCADDCLASPVLLVASESDRHPRQYILYTRASGAMVGLGSTHPDIKPEQMGLRDFKHYKARDGLTIPAYVTTPPGKAAGPLPTVVLVHGGPWVRGAHWAWDADAQFLASRGYLVIEPEFRGSSGYGHAHFEAGMKQWGGAMQDDLADAALWAVKQGWADPKRVAIMGASYGGYATLMGLIKNPEIFRCGVEWAGVTDIQLMFNTTQSDASTELLNYSMRTLIGDPDKAEDAAMFKQNSPLLRAAELKQPLLMAHGAEDRRVPMEHANKFLSAVRSGNPAVASIVYSDEGHGWRHEADNIDFWTKVDAFLDKNLKRAP